MAEQTNTTNNPFEDLVPTTGVKKWACEARTDLARYIKPLTIKNDVFRPAQAVEAQLVSLENAIGQRNVPEAAARATFIEWLNLNDYDGGFMFYAEKKDEEVKEANRVAAEAATNKIIQSARDVAVKTRNQYATGGGNTVGTVIAGMSDVVSGRTYVGTSGNFAYSTKQNPLMRELLQATRKREDWEPDACAEVDAMNQYLNENLKIKFPSDVPRGKLFFHAETWNWDDAKWQGRKACQNCDQWIKRIGAGRV